MDENERENIIVLIDENGEEDPFEYLDTIEYEGMEYVVLTQVSEETGEASGENEENSGENGGSEDELEVVIMKILHEENGDDSFVTEENDEIVEAVFQIFEERYENS